MWYDDGMAKKQAGRKPASGKGWRTHLKTRRPFQELPDTSMIPWLPNIPSAKLPKRKAVRRSEISKKSRANWRSSV